MRPLAQEKVDAVRAFVATKSQDWQEQFCMLAWAGTDIAMENGADPDEAWTLVLTCQKLLRLVKEAS